MINVIAAIGYFDDSATPGAATPEMRRLLSRASLYLAREVHTKARAVLRAEMKQQNAKQQPAEPRKS